MKYGLAVERQSKFKGRILKVSGARQDRKISKVTAVTHPPTYPPWGHMAHPNPLPS